jgi:hypothetical protein
MNTLITGWPTHILTGQITETEIANRLTEHLLENYNIAGGSGFEANVNILNDPQLQDFKQYIVIPAFESYLQQVLNLKIDDFKTASFRGWLTGGAAGYNMDVHNHSGSQLAGVFYLLNEEPDSGDIVLYDPRANANRSYERARWGKLFQSMKFKTPSLSFIIFPSFVYHSVEVYRGKLRVAIPVDLYVG